MEAADARKLESLAFCSISTGVYGYPIAQAAPIAVRTVLNYLRDNPQTSLKRVVFAMFGDTEFDEFASALGANGSEFALKETFE